MNEKAKELLTIRGTLSSIIRVEKYLLDKIEAGNTELEKSICESGKTIEDCWKYILFKAKKLATSCVGGSSAMVSDEEVFSWCEYYYLHNVEAEKEMNPPKPTAQKKEKKSTDKKSGKKSEDKSADEKILSESEESTDKEISADEKSEESPQIEDETPITGQMSFADIGSQVSEPLEGFIKTDEDLFPEDEKKEEQAAEIEKKEEPVIKDGTPEEITPQEVKPAPVKKEYSGAKALKCCICGKTMGEAFPDKDEATVAKWCEAWQKKYGGRVFCCKEHLDDFAEGRRIIL